MKQNKIIVAGKQVLENSDELEKGYVEIELEAYDILSEIDSEDVMDYAHCNLDMRHEDEFESSLDDFDKDELVEELELRGYNFYSHIDLDSCIDFLEGNGFTVYESEESKYDYVDNCLFDDISNKFNSLSVFDRQKMRDLIIKL